MGYRLPVGCFTYRPSFIHIFPAWNSKYNYCGLKPGILYREIMTIHTLAEGSYSVDATKKFIPFDPQTDNFKDRPGSLFIHVHPFLVQTAEDLILFDTGLGYKDTRDELWLHQHIRGAGYQPED